VLFGGSVIGIRREGYEFTEKWYIHIGASPD